MHTPTSSASPLESLQSFVLQRVVFTCCFLCGFRVLLLSFLFLEWWWSFSFLEGGEVKPSATGIVPRSRADRNGFMVIVMSLLSLMMVDGDGELS